jgi:hypothetical protein
VTRTAVTPTPNYFFPTSTPTPITPTATFTPVGTATPLATVNPRYYTGQGDKYNCIDFNSQAEAQAVLRADANDPNKLDISTASSATTPDGIACNTTADAPEWGASFFYPEPYDKTPVPTPNGGRKTSPTFTPTTNSVSTPGPTATSGSGTRTPIRTFEPSP